MVTNQKVILLGVVGDKPGATLDSPEVKVTVNGKNVCNFWMRTGKTYWRCAAWERLGEICKEYLIPGELVYLEGDDVRVSTWLDNGEPMGTLEMTARLVRFGLDEKEE
ncbi:MAG: single-stranded DNA-binding protein [Sphaerochaeta sp.]|nr:single-stranded DNA-binding protein [Sphaerochaeta sp.]